METQIELVRTDSTHPQFLNLIRELDLYLAGVNGDDNPFFAQFNFVDTIRHVVLAFAEEKAVGCGAFKEFEHGVAEIKRMYVLPEMRGCHVGSRVLKEVESWASEEGFERSVLETAVTMLDARRLYERNGYEVIPNYGPYVGKSQSVCMTKRF